MSKMLWYEPCARICAVCVPWWRVSVIQWLSMMLRSMMMYEFPCSRLSGPIGWSNCLV